jgi:hypothetical protein
VNILKAELMLCAEVKGYITCLEGEEIGCGVALGNSKIMQVWAGHFHVNTSQPTMGGNENIVLLLSYSGKRSKMQRLHFRWQSVVPHRWQHALSVITGSATSSNRQEDIQYYAVNFIQTEISD